MNTDPVADVLTRLRNASAAGHSHTSIPASKVIREIVQILAKAGFVAGHETISAQPRDSIRVELKYD